MSTLKLLMFNALGTRATMMPLVVRHKSPRPSGKILLAICALWQNLADADLLGTTSFQIILSGGRCCAPLFHEDIVATLSCASVHTQTGLVDLEEFRSYRSICEGS